jgi:hypothetical protein
MAGRRLGLALLFSCAEDSSNSHQPTPPPLPAPAGLIEVARYRVIRTSGLLARWEAAAAADPKADYTAPEFTQPMRWGVDGWLFGA